MKKGRTKRRMSVEKFSTQFAVNAAGLFQTELNWFSSDLFECQLDVRVLDRLVERLTNCRSLEYTTMHP